MFKLYVFERQRFNRIAVCRSYHRAWSFLPSPCRTANYSFYRNKETTLEEVFPDAGVHDRGPLEGSVSHIIICTLEMYSLNRDVFLR